MSRRDLVSRHRRRLALGGTEVRLEASAVAAVLIPVGLERSKRAVPVTVTKDQLETAPVQLAGVHGHERSRGGEIDPNGFISSRLAVAVSDESVIGLPNRSAIERVGL